MKKITLFYALLLCFQGTFSQYFKDNKDVETYKGFFTFYYDASKDKVYLEVDKIDQEFLYVNALSEGIGSNDIGLDRGQLGDGVVVKFVKAGNKLLLIQPNQRYRAITENEEEKRSIEEAFAKSVLYGFPIMEVPSKAASQSTTYLIDATDFFMRDAHGVAARLEQSGQGTFSLDKTKSAFNLKRTKGFPKNSEFDVLLTFSGRPKGYEIRSVTPDASLISVHQHHSFVKLPDDGYKPRIFDTRSGCYPMSYMDYATPVDQPIVKRYIRRHRLEKKDPSADMSEAKEPIIYYLDRGTPEPIRSALLEGASWWNQAFEAAGYKDAFQVKMLPEGADPLDLRYNMIQWVHRSTRGWSYGASISDPRTGEILKGHVSLGSLRIRQDFMIAQALKALYKNNDTDDKAALDFALARIRQLSAHEVGHTLGFSHNFAASTNSRSSVMDYPHPKLSVSHGAIDFSKAYDTGIGVWDKVTVAYAYQDFIGDEEAQLRKILKDAEEKDLRYISDQDARPLGGAHPYAHLWDNGKNPAKELDNILEVRKIAIENFSKDNIRSYEPYSVLEDVFVPLYFFHRYQTEAVAKIIGGVDYSYAVKGDSQKIAVPVDGKMEQEALKALLQTIDVETIAIPKRLLNLFPPRAMGYNRTRESFKSKTGVAFDPYGAVETASEMTLSLLFHPERAGRMVQYKSLDDTHIGLEDAIDKVIAASFKKSHKDSYHQELQNVVNSQVLNQLFTLATVSDTYEQVNAIAIFKLNELASWLASRNSSGTQKMYEQQWIRLINDFKEDPSTYQRIEAPKIPDGSPIGHDGW